MTTDDVPPPIGALVKRRREELGLTQDETVTKARSLGHQLTGATLRGIEQGKSRAPHPRTRRALAAALEVSDETVSGWIEGRVPQPNAPAGLDEIRRLVAAEVSRVQPSAEDNLFREAMADLTVEQREKFRRIFQRFADELAGHG